MSEEKNSLIFIPDISGFTDFVNNTEITHSQHIISELLESVIECNELEMVISEVEGDAIIFYKYRQFPALEQLILQAKKMFIRFHEHLKTYESQRICQCGACSSATSLTLKFIIHRGALGFTNIRNQKKPFGADVVLAHKLLKNVIRDKEYILITENAAVDTDLKRLEEDIWTDLREVASNYKSYGKISYYYLSLTDLHEEVKEPIPVAKPEKMRNPVSGELQVNMDILESYELLSNFELKKLWQNGVKDFKFERDKINRIGTRHICVFDKGTAEFESVSNDFGDNKFVYGERLLKFPLARELIFYFILEPMEEGTNIRTEIHYKPFPYIGRIFDPIIRMNAKKIIQKFISSFPKGTKS